MFIWNILVNPIKCYKLSLCLLGKHSVSCLCTGKPLILFM